MKCCRPLEQTAIQFEANLLRLGFTTSLPRGCERIVWVRRVVLPRRALSLVEKELKTKP
jgi:hypothetical protein